MALARPAYKVTIGSYSQGWAYSTVQGEAPVVGNVQILDGLTLTWGYDRSAYPGQPVPETCSFSLAGALSGASALPDPSPGDQVYVNLDRPGPTWPGNPADLIPYVHLDGVLDEPESVAHSLGAQLNLIAVDLVASLGEELVSDSNAWPAESLNARIARIARATPFNFIGQSALDVNYPTVAAVPAPAGQAVLSELLKTLNFNIGTRLILRAIRKPYTDAMFGSGLLDVDVVPDPSSQVTYFLQVLADSTPNYQTPDKLVVSGNFVIRQRRAGRLSSLLYAAILSAANVLKGTLTWRKSRADAVNQLKVIGQDAAGAELSVIHSYPDLVSQYGANTRVVETNARLDLGNWGNPANPTSDLPGPVQAVPGWATDGFTFTTENAGLTDGDLDAYAPLFYPRKVADPSVSSTDGYLMDLFVAVVDVDKLHAVTGTDLAGSLIGATFTIRKGVLRIEAVLRNGVREGGTSASFDDVATTAAIANCQFQGAGAQLRIDQALTFEDMTLIGV